MNEITNENFKEIYPQLEHALKDAHFITFDSEFSGIEDNIRNSLFDSTNERYDKSRNAIQPYIIVQFGITAFQRVNDKNEYSAEIFNFFLFPRSIPSKTTQFLCHGPSLEFLAKHGFDFNKFVYHGIPYIDEKDQKILQQQIQDDTLFYNIEQHISLDEQDDFKNYYNKIAEWLNTVDETISYKINTSTPSFQYFMHKKLRKCFPLVWTLSGKNTVTVITVQQNIKEALEKEEGSILENALMESYLGFSKVFDLLVTLKKPMVGHNALLDLMFMYQQFYKPLPHKYIEFKNNIHKLFSTIYDTKFLSNEFKEILQPEERWKINSLGGIFAHFTQKNINLIPGSPVITLNNNNPDQPDDITNCMRCHNAGWDSYFTGYIFIKLIHIFATKQYSSTTSHLKYFTHTELMSNIQRYANCINISRGSTSHIKLDGPDPSSTRPRWLYVKTLTPELITETEIYEQMSKFGSIDVKKYAPKRMLVAVGNHKSARDILNCFKQNEKLYVVPFNRIRHSPSVQLALWSSVIVSGGIIAWIMHQKFQKTS